jgi:hypothetical protein
LCHQHLYLEQFHEVTRSFREPIQNKQTPWPLVRVRTMPTERPPLVDEI